MVEKLQQAMNEKLEELAPALYCTNVASNICNLLQNKPKPYRVVYDKNLNFYFIGNAYEYIHLDLLMEAFNNGFYPDLIYSNDVEDYTDRELTKGNLLFFSFAPSNNKQLDLEKSSDGYTRKYVYSFGTIYCHELSKLENFGIYKLLGEPDKKENIFESFKSLERKNKMNIKQLNECLERVLNEVKPMRGWNGKLSHITDFIDYLEDHDFLTKTEKDKKHSLFNRYYRWYNDKDIPRGLKTPTNRMEVQYGGDRIKSRVNKELEEMLEEFLKQILSKYLPKVDRKEFRKSIILSEINRILRVLKLKDAGAVLYFSKNLKNTDSNIQEKLDNLKELYEKYNKIAKNIKDPQDGYSNLDTFVFYYGYKEVAKYSEEGKQVVDDILEILEDLTTMYTELKNGLTQTEALDESVDVYGKPGDNLDLQFRLVKEDKTGKTWSLEGVNFVQAEDDDLQEAVEECLYYHFFPVWKKNGVQEFDTEPLDYLEGENQGWVYVNLA